MTKPYRELRKETAARMGDDGTKLQCRPCGTPTAWETLSNLGGRCQACYEAFCRMPVAAFNAAVKSGEPTRAYARRDVKVTHAHQVGDLLAGPKLTREQLADAALELGIDVGGAS